MNNLLTILICALCLFTFSATAQYQLDIETNAKIGEDLHISGQIGVGTTTPSNNAGLHLYDAGNGNDLYIENTYPFIQLIRSGNGNSGIQFKEGNANEAEMYYYGSGEVLTLHTGGFSNIDDGLNIDTDNEVGIGTDTPDAKLDIQGPTNSTSTILNVRNNYSGTSNLYGIDSYAVPSDGYGYGARMRGGYIGAYGWAVGGNSDRTIYGVYGYASGGGRGYGVYSFSDMKVRQRLFVGTSTTMEDASPNVEVLVDGEIACEELIVEKSEDWPDYVFQDDYKLRSIYDLEKSIQEKGHLPGIPSAQEVEEGGLKVGEMQYKMMEKIEELTLYVIQLKKENDELRAMITADQADK